MVTGSKVIGPSEIREWVRTCFSMSEYVNLNKQTTLNSAEETTVANSNIRF